MKAAVVDQMLEKERRLKLRRATKSIRRVLIYMGELSAGIEEGGAFDALIPFERLLRRA